MSSAPINSSASDMADTIMNCEEGKLFVGGLSWETDIVSLHNYMSQFGEVSEVCIKMDSMTGRSRGFGFVKFKLHEDAMKVLNTKAHLLDGKNIDPKPALPATKHISNKTKIFVGGLKNETTEEILREYFCQFGKIIEVEFFYDKITKKRRGFCFIEFEDEITAENSLNKSYHTVATRKLEVKPAFTREQQHIMAIRGMWPPSFQLTPPNISQMSLLSEPNHVYNMPYSFFQNFYPIPNNNILLSRNLYPAINTSPVMINDDQMPLAYVDYMSNQHINTSSITHQDISNSQHSSETTNDAKDSSNSSSNKNNNKDNVSPKNYEVNKSQNESKRYSSKKNN